MKLGLGTAQFGLNYGIANQQGQVSRDEGRAILDFARASGMDTLDTAIAYGDSEQKLGEIGVQDWQVITKLPAVPEGCRDIAQWVTKSFDVSLARLRVRALYGILVHQADQLLEPGGDRLYHALHQLKHDRLVENVGVSIYDPAELDLLCSRYQLDLVQAPFNIIDRRLVDSGWLSRLEKQGTELHVRSVFLQGLLLMAPSDRPQKFERWTSVWSRWDDWLEQTGLTPVQASLRYVLSFSQINKVIVGVDSLEQLKEILLAATGPLPDVPDDLQSDDTDLLSPVRWAVL